MGPAGFCWARGPVHQCTSVASLVPRVNPKDPQLRICNASHRVISCVRRAIESRREPALQGVGHALGRPGTSTHSHSPHHSLTQRATVLLPAPPRWQRRPPSLDPSDASHPSTSTCIYQPSGPWAHRPPAPQSSARLASMLQPLTPSVSFTATYQLHASRPMIACIPSLRRVSRSAMHSRTIQPMMSPPASRPWSPWIGSGWAEKYRIGRRSALLGDGWVEIDDAGVCDGRRVAEGAAGAR